MRTTTPTARAAPAVSRLRWFRRVALAVVVIGGAIMVLTAVLDATSIVPRMGGGVVPPRPLWLHCFSVAGLTAVVGFIVARAEPVPAAGARWILLAVALANLTVPILQLRYAGFGLVLPLFHLAAAGLMVVLVALARPARPRPAEPPTG